MERDQQADQELVTLCLQGNRLAEYRLYEKYVQAMYHTAMRMVGDEASAMDVLQEAFLKVFQNLRQFRQEASLGAWIKRIVVNMAINQLRQRKTLAWQELPPDLDQSTALPAEVISTLQTTDLHKAILDLPPGSRTIFTMYAVEGYAHQEIADMLGITESTSKSQYFRAKQLLQSQLKAMKYV